LDYAEFPDSRDLARRAYHSRGIFNAEVAGSAEVEKREMRNRSFPFSTSLFPRVLCDLCVPTPQEFFNAEVAGSAGGRKREMGDRSFPFSTSLFPRVLCDLCVSTPYGFFEE
jgi:hypothetical protein